MKTVIVASHDISMTDALIARVASIVVTEQGSFAVRQNRAGKITSGPEMLVADLAERLHYLIVEYAPRGKGGRSSVYDRDYALVNSAEKVIAFFHPSRIMEGGTGHVVYAALNLDIPVEAWVVDDENLREVGADSGGREWLKSQHESWAAGDEDEEETPWWSGRPWPLGTTITTSSTTSTSGTTSVPLTTFKFSRAPLVSSSSSSSSSYTALKEMFDWDPEEYAALNLDIPVEEDTS